MKAPFIRSARWNELSNDDIVSMFNRYLDDVAIHPNALIVSELRELKAATLEVLEDRTMSTVYRIRETGVVFHVEAENGECWAYDDFDDYLQDDPIDELVNSFVSQPKSYEIIDQTGNVFTVRRNKPPRFKARYNMETGDIELFDNEDAFDLLSAPKYARRISEVIAKFLKNKNAPASSIMS